jgi:hypothetical protein
MAIKILENRQLGFGEGIGAYDFEVFSDREQDLQTYWRGREIEDQLRDSNTGIYLIPKQRAA